MLAIAEGASFAQVAPAPAPSAGFEMVKTLLFAGAIFAVLYFLILRPQRKKDQQRKEMLSRVERGQRVVTIGGIYGEVQSIKEEYCILLVDAERGVTLKLRRSAIHEILPEDSGEEEKK
jgi:preprotein translocase subunit YajC